MADDADPDDPDRTEIQGNDTPPAPPPLPAAGAADADVPLRFGRYTVLRREPGGGPYELGRGGMGVTYKASDPGLGKRIVVLKVINALLLGHDLKARERFRREAGLAAQLHHPHIATVFDIGEERGEDFYVMEFIQGEDLLSRLRRQGRFDVVTALQITGQVAEALGAAWERSIVHRDIKPGNVMLADRPAHRAAGAVPLVKVVDFGLAKALKDAVGEGEGHLTTELTGTSQRLFSPSYASPEQIENADLDVRSDLYSLGVSLWQMLAGHPTFGSTSYQRAIVGHLSKPPPFDELRQLNVSEPIIALLAHLLEKEPGDRPATPDAALDEITAALREEERGPGRGEPVLSGHRVSADPAVSVDPGETRYPPAASTTAAVGDSLDGRYRLDALLGTRPGGPVFRAADLEVGGAPVCLRFLNVEWHTAAAADFFPALDAEIARVHAAPHPNLRAVFGRGAYLVSEWIEGFTLLDLLRQRGCLPLDETLRLGHQIAAAIDHASAHALGSVDLALHQVFVAFSGELPEPAKAQRLEIPLAQWPPFAVKLDPLAVLPGAGASGVDQTLLKARPLGQGDDPVTTLAFLVYELLAGSPLAPFRYKPLPGLDERGNATLRRACEVPGAFARASEFCAAMDPAGLPLPVDQTPAVRPPAPVPAPVATPAEPLPLAVPSTPRPRRRKRVPALLLGIVLLGAAGSAAGYWHQRTVEKQRRDEAEQRQREAVQHQQQIEEDERRRAEQEREKILAQAEADARDAAEQKRQAQIATAQANEKRRHDREVQQAAARAEAALHDQQAAADTRRQKEDADRAARAKTLQAVLATQPGDEVVVASETSVYLGTQPQRKAHPGEHFRVVESFPQQSLVVVPALDANGKEIAGVRLSVPAAALQTVPIDVGAVLGKAVQDAKSGNVQEAARLLARAARSAPDEPAVAELRTRLNELAGAQAAFNQAQQAAQNGAAEVARLRRNAEITGRPNPLDGNDYSNQSRARLISARADEVEKANENILPPAQRQLDAARNALDQVALPHAP